MWANRKRVLQSSAFSLLLDWLFIYLVVVIIAHVLIQMIKTPESLSAAVTFAVFARVFWIVWPE